MSPYDTVYIPKLNFGDKHGNNRGMTSFYMSLLWLVMKYNQLAKRDTAHAQNYDINNNGGEQRRNPGEFSGIKLLDFMSLSTLFHDFNKFMLFCIMFICKKNVLNPIIG